MPTEARQHRRESAPSRSTGSMPHSAAALQMSRRLWVTANSHTASEGQPRPACGKGPRCLTLEAPSREPDLGREGACPRARGPAARSPTSDPKRTLRSPLGDPGPRRPTAPLPGQRHELPSPAPPAPLPHRALVTWLYGDDARAKLAAAPQGTGSPVLLSPGTTRC